MTTKYGLSVLIVLILIAIFGIKLSKIENTKKVTTEQVVKVNNDRINLNEDFDLSNYCIKSYFYQDSMQYMLIKDNGSGGLVVVNLTKDKLACEYYKKQLNK